MDMPSSPNQGIELSERINYDSNQHHIQPGYYAQHIEGGATEGQQQPLLDKNPY